MKIKSLGKDKPRAEGCYHADSSGYGFSDWNYSHLCVLIPLCRSLGFPEQYSAVWANIGCFFCLDDGWD